MDIFNIFNFSNGNMMFFNLIGGICSTILSSATFYFHFCLTSTLEYINTMREFVIIGGSSGIELEIANQLSLGLVYYQHVDSGMSAINS